MTSSRTYSRPKNYVLAAIQDIKELQNGKGTFEDVPNGMINFTIEMYYQKFEYQFHVTDIGSNRCQVEIGIDGDVKKKREKRLREYLLLDSMLATNSQIELMNTEQAAKEDQAASMAEGRKGLLCGPGRVFSILVVCVALIIGAVVLYTAIQPASNGFPDYRQASQHTPTPVPGVMTYTDKDQEGMDNNGIKILDYTTATIPADSKNTPLLSFNPNDNTYSFTYEIALADTEETVNRSGLMDQGTLITDFNYSDGNGEMRPAIDLADSGRTLIITITFETY